MPTLQDIADLAGTSKQTVSAVLSGKAKAARISGPRVDQIRQIASEVGYIGNWRAQAFARQRTQTIGVLFAKLSPFQLGISMQLIHDLSIALQRRGYQLLFVPVLQPDGEVVPGVEDQRIDGAVVLEPLLPVYDRILPRLKIPCVLANLATDHGGVRHYVFDDAGGMTALLDHLSGLGHRGVELWMGPTSNPRHYSSHERIAAFEAWRGRGDADARARVVVAETADYLDALVERLGRGDAPTAVVGYKSAHALELMHGLIERGVRVPADMSLASFDDLDATSLVNPALTVVSAPLDEVGRVAAEELVAAIERGEALPAGRRVFPEELVIRDSTAAARR